MKLMPAPRERRPAEQARNPPMNGQLFVSSLLSEDSPLLSWYFLLFYVWFFLFASVFVDVTESCFPHMRCRSSANLPLSSSSRPTYIVCLVCSLLLLSLSGVSCPGIVVLIWRD